MSVDDLLSTVKHAETALHAEATKLRAIAHMVTQLQTSEHSSRALRKLSKDLEAIGLPDAKLVKDIAAAFEKLAIDLTDISRIAALLDVMAKQLKRTSKNALSAPADETPPDGMYLERLHAALGTEYEWMTPALSRWLVSHMRSMRSIIRRLLGPAEITGEAELVAAAQTLLDEVNKGPSIQHGR